MEAIVDDKLLAHDDQHEDPNEADAEHVGDDSLHHWLVDVLHRGIPGSASRTVRLRLKPIERVDLL